MQIPRIALALGLAVGMSSAAFAAPPGTKAVPVQARVATSTPAPAVTTKTTARTNARENDKTGAKVAKSTSSRKARHAKRVARKATARTAAAHKTA